MTVYVDSLSTAALATCMYSRGSLTCRLSLTRSTSSITTPRNLIKPLPAQRYLSNMALNREGIFSRTAEDQENDVKARLSNFEDQAWKQWPAKAQVSIEHVLQMKT